MRCCSRLEIGATNLVRGPPVSPNPWVTRTDTANEQDAPGEDRPPVRGGAAFGGVATPVAGVPHVDRADQLPQFEANHQVDLWVVGAHGGAGESVVATWLDEVAESAATVRASDHRWPLSETAPPAAVLVSRTNGYGLARARLAAREWASSQVSVDLVGLILVADAPGRLLPPLRQQIKQLRGVVPHLWVVPYLAHLRLEASTTSPLPPRAARVVRDVLTTFTSKEK